MRRLIEKANAIVKRCFREQGNADEVIDFAESAIFEITENKSQQAFYPISKIILGGMSANLCVEAHLRELLEQGFEVAVIKDATAGARHPELGDGYQAAMVNFGYMANAVMSTDEAVAAMQAG